MTSFEFFAIQYAMSFSVYAALTAWYLWPRLAALPVRRALMILVAPHALRHIGLGSIIPVATDPALTTTEFAINQAWGDLVAALLACLAFVALRSRWRSALWLVVIFNVEGLYDLSRAVLDGVAVKFWTFQLGAFWNVITFMAPLLFLFHLVIFIVLAKRWREYAAELRPA
ncbi:MAG: hypothetical protein K1X88_11315 [Nannocystaceae bacterium]|nr:hypothetical protein [Nannocystaceae bacterium]